MLSLDDAPFENKMWKYSWTKRAWHLLIYIGMDYASIIGDERGLILTPKD